jgi:tetratricopeptide (TPR) repeat protein
LDVSISFLLNSLYSADKMRQQPVNRKCRPEIFLSPWPDFPITTAVLLVGSFLYVWLRVEPLLEYYSDGPYFYRHWAFLDTFLGRPGGLASYAGVFLAQFNGLNWLGTLVFVLFQCAVLLVTVFCPALVSGRAPGFVALVPVFVLQLLRNRSGSPVSELTVGLLLALAASTAHLALPWRNGWLLTAVSGLVSALLFYLAGWWSALLFAVLCCMFLCVQRENWPAGLGCLLLALPAPIWESSAGSIELVKLVNPWPEGVGWGLAVALYGSVPVAGAVLLLLPRPGTTAASNPQQAASGRWFETRWQGQATVALAIVLGWAVVWLTFDRRQKLQAEIDYHVSRGEYEAVLAAARQAKALNHPAKVRLQLALYHTGRLSEDLFSFLNLIDDAPSKGLGEDWRAQSQPLFELGLVNDAEHMAHEALELEGDRPDLLRLLARINLLKGRPQAAQVFLNVLSLIPFQGEPANESWPAIDPQMWSAQRAALARMHSPMMLKDVPHDSVGPMLDVALASNPTNRMAFEYVMAHYLIELDLKRVVERLPLLDNFKYARIPRPYEEALLLYQQVAGVQVELRGRTIRPETAARFRQFRDAVRQLDGTAEALAAMAANFGDTYWCYYYAHLMHKRVAESHASSQCASGY